MSSCKILDVAQPGARGAGPPSPRTSGLAAVATTPTAEAAAAAGTRRHKWHLLLPWRLPLCRAVQEVRGAEAEEGAPELLLPRLSSKPVIRLRAHERVATHQSWGLHAPRQRRQGRRLLVEELGVLHLLAQIPHAIEARRRVHRGLLQDLRLLHLLAQLPQALEHGSARRRTAPLRDLRVPPQELGSPLLQLQVLLLELHGSLIQCTLEVLCHTCCSFTAVLEL
mmetsp:Transcript_115256/g.366408  ORF Transcript_115256/g.366408 Transcript_115256/m.366408 type:complete len:224 (-) Transcript_115256:2775-3446(-)